MPISDIKKLMREDVNTPIPLESRFVAPSRTDTGLRFLGDQTHISSLLNSYSVEVNKYIHDIFGHLKINPFDEHRVDAFRETYFFSSDVEGATNFVNTKHGHKQFVQEITEITDENKYPAILLVGPKGSGKTFYINYLLSTEARNLYSKNKIVMFRLDVSQLYSSHPEIRQKEGDSEELKSRRDLLEFLTTKVLFTAYLIKDKYPELEEFWQEGKNRVLSVLRNSWTRKRRLRKYRSDEFENTSPEACFDYIKELFSSIVSDSEIEPEHIYYSEMKDFKSIITKHVGFMSVVVFDGFIAFLREKGLRATVIVDGVDNIDYYNEKEVYDSTLRQINQCFIASHGVDGNDAKAIIALRNESAAHLSKIAHNFYRIRTKEYKINENQSIIDILALKCEVAANPKSDFIKNKRRTCVKSAIEKELDSSPKKVATNISSYFSSFSSFGYKYFSNLRKIVYENEEMHGLDVKGDTDILKIVYGGNVRAFLYNFLSIHKYERLVSRKERYLSHRNSYKNYSSSRYVFTEGQLLNGRLYLDTNKEPYQFGKCIPNIFWFDCHKKTDTWHGLCLYRVLQLACSNGFEKDELVLTIADKFDYDIWRIESAIEMATQHGLFFTTYDFTTYDFTTNDVEKSNDVIYRTSEKGRFLLRYVLSDLNVIYFLSLDTPLSNFVQNRSIYLRYHTNREGNPWDNYPEACILTSLTFIRHIITQNEIELSRFTSSDKTVFELDKSFLENILTDMERLVNNQLKHNESTGESILADIKGRSC